MKRFLLFVFAIVAFAACEQAPIEEQSAIRQDAPETLTVGFEGDDTRVQLNKAQKTVWNNGDAVSVFYRTNGNQKWQYKGKDGVRQANLSRVQDATGNTAITKTIVVYPYNETYWLNTDSYCIEATTPATQHYAVDSYGVGDNLMVSQGEFTQLSLKNVYGWLKLQLTGDGETIKSIKFRGNDGEQVAGLIYVDTATAEATLAAEMGDADDNNAGGNLVFEDTILTEVTLDCGEGVELLPVVTAFYIAIPPQTFEKGFTVEITDNSDYTMVQSTSKKQVIERNHIQPMAAFTFVNPNGEGEPKPANNEIWYTATEKVEPYWDDANTYGVRLVTNTWDEATGKGVYTFAGDVTKVGAEAFLECNKLQSVTLPDSATEIGSNAFKNCDGLKEVTIGDGVTNIGSCAFYDCDALTTVSFGDSLQTIGDYVFYSCYALSDVVLGGNITTVGNRAFYECKKLTRAVIGDSVTSIGEYAFYGCSSLSDVIIGKGLTEISSYAFTSCAMQSIVLPDNVTTIEYNAFYGCSKLENVTFGDNIETIEPYAFQDCKAIKALYGKYVTTDGRALIIDDKLILYAKASGSDYAIPNSVTTIANRAFSYANLSSVTISENVTSIEDYAFSYCSNLKKVYINALIPPTRGNNSFYNNASGRRFYVYDEAVNTYKKLWSSDASNIYGNGSYDGAETTTIYYTTTDENIVNSDYLSIKENTYVDGQGKMVVCGKLDMLPNNAFSSKNTLTSVTIPEGITCIGANAFAWCWNLTNVIIPEGVTHIEYSAFRSCDISDITLPNSVTHIGDDAFNDCDLTSITLPNNLIHIGDRAFENCDFTTVTIPNSVTHIGARAFNSWYVQQFKGKFAHTDGRCLIQDETLIAYARNSGNEYIIPEAATKIGAYAFYDHSLSSITLHENIYEIGDYAFYSYSGECRIYITSSEPAYLNGYSIFTTDNYDLKIFVPKEAENRYKSDYYWKNYAMLMYPYDYNRVQTNYEIWYTSVDNAIVEPNNRNAFGDANIVSNSYQYGRCIITFDRDITEIGYDAFWDCNSLVSVTIPDSVITIGSSAFCDCDSLTSVTIPDSVTEIGDNAFAYCGYLSNIVLGNSVETIGNDAFNGCGLKSITIPDSVTTIGNGVFSQCWDLAEFKGKYASEDGKCLIMNGILKSFAPFDIKSYTIPNGVTEIGNSAFNNVNIENVTIPDSVIKIGSHAFAHCNFNEVIIGNNVSVIDEYAFWNCTSLTSVTVSNSVKTIGKAAFAACYKLQEFKGEHAQNNGRIFVIDGVLTAFAPYGLTEYTIPDSVTTIGDNAFYYCTSLTSVTIPDSVTEIGESAFYYCTSLTSVNIPDSVTSIGSSAFYSCDSLTSVNIPDSVTSIGSSAFSYCKSLISVNIPDSVTSIGSSVFYSCDSLTSVNIPDSVTSIGDNAFARCDSLTSVYCKATTPPSLGWNVFVNNGSGLKIYVPTESVEAYKSAAYWKNHASAIVGYDFENGVVVE